jgi:hypothetical protein
MIRLASQPQMPPTISQIMIPMSSSLLFADRLDRGGGRFGITDA